MTDEIPIDTDVAPEVAEVAPEVAEVAIEAPKETVPTNVCPECGGKLFRDYKHAEVACAKCGLVIEGSIADLGAETRSFDSESWLKKTRTGSPSSRRRRRPRAGPCQSRRRRSRAGAQTPVRSLWGAG